MAVVKGSPVRRKETSTLPSSPRLDALAELEGQKAIAAVKAGLDASLVRQLAMRLDLTLEDLAVPLHLTSRTLHRRLEHGRLSLDESERLLSLAKIFLNSSVSLFFPIIFTEFLSFIISFLKLLLLFMYKISSIPNGVFTLELVVVGEKFVDFSEH